MGSVFKRSRVHQNGGEVDYWYIVYSINGKRKWEAVGEVGSMTKSVAKDLLRKREQQVKLGQWDMLEVQVPTLREFVPQYVDYLRDVKCNRTWKKSREHLKKVERVFGNRKLSGITTEDIDAYKAARITQVTPTTVNRELEVLSHLFTVADRWKKFFGRNPVSQAGLFRLNNQVKRILTLSEEERLLSCSAPHLKPIITVAINTSMRKGEILTLTWEDVDFENNLITVRHTMSKSKKTKLIPISSRVRKLLLEQKLKSGGSKYVFIFEGRPIRDVRRAFEKACKRAGVEGLRFHDLRHTAATRLVEAGVGIEKVSRLLGHSTLQMTMRYAHPDVSLRDAVEKLANFNSLVSQSVSQEEMNKTDST
jgi:integrase